MGLSVLDLSKNGRKGDVLPWPPCSGKNIMKEWDLGLPYFQTNSRVLLGIETKKQWLFSGDG